MRRTLTIAIAELARLDRSIARRDRASGADAVRDVADAIGLVRRASDTADARDAAAIPGLSSDLDWQAAMLTRRRSDLLAGRRSDLLAR